MTADPVRAALARAASALAAASDTPRLDAELLMAHALGVPREAMLLARLDDAAPEGFAALVERRRAHEPVAYIMGTRDFWTITLAVGPGVLVPRPDSETLIEAAMAHFAGTPGPSRVLDLGTGPGTLLLAALAEWPEATGIGIDASEAALGHARANAARIAPGRAELRAGNWTGGVDDRFDLILCNPPYIRDDDPLPPDVAGHEPHEALFAGADGLDDYRRIVPALPRLIAPGGIACIEVGKGQADDVIAMVAATGLVPGQRADLAGVARCITAIPAPW